MATIGDIEWYRGDSFPIELTIKDKRDGTAIDITGYSFLMTVTSVKDPSDILSQVFQVEGAIEDAIAGTVTLTPSSIQTDLTPATYYYDIQMTDANSNIRTIAKFKLKILQDNTKTASSISEHSINFDDSNLVGNVLTVTHGLGDMYPVVTVYDNNNELVSVSVNPIDENSYSIDFGGPISGTWHISTRVLSNRYTETFDDSNLVGNVLTVTHGLGTAYPAVAVYDENDELVDVPVTSISASSFSVDFSGPISGTWHLTAI